MEERTYNKEERFDARTIEALKLHYTEILRLLGEDPTREGLLKTPERVAKAMSFLTKGYEENPLEIIRSATFREEYKQMVLVKDIELYSLCEHHMLPFYGTSPTSPTGTSRDFPKSPASWSATPAACRCRSG